MRILNQARISIMTLALFFPGCAQFSERAPARAAQIRYPESKRSDVVESRFGIEIKDPYRWLEYNDAEVETWIEQQNKFAREYLNQLPNKNFLKSRFSQSESSTTFELPKIVGKKSFQLSRGKDHEEKAIILNDDSKPKIVLQGNIGYWEPNDSGDKIAYTMKRNDGADAFLKIRDLKLENDLPDQLSGFILSSLAWDPSGDGFFYVHYPEGANLSERIGASSVRYHKLGTSQTADLQIFPPSQDPTVGYSITRSSDRHWLFLERHLGTTRNEILALNLRERQSGFRDLFIGRKGRAMADAWKGLFYLKTTDSSPNGKLVVFPTATSQGKAWKVLAESNVAKIDDFAIRGQKLVITWLKNASSEIEVRSLQGKRERAIPLPELGTVSEVAGSAGSPNIFFRFESFTSPSRTFNFNLKTGNFNSAIHLKSRRQISVKVTQEWFPSKDGTLISMFVVRRADQQNTAPFILKGYGGFGNSQTPYFSREIATWVEQGGGFALVNIRGGGEYGQQWHLAGTKTLKQNTFDDFIGAAEFLIERSYTTSQKLAVWGASNGGLVVGAAMVQRPELFKVVVCEAPILDMVRFPRFASGKFFESEYGSPEVEDEFKAIIKYSPYHNVREDVSYPDVIFVSGQNDAQVGEIHAYKMAAALQNAKRNSGLSLLRIEPNGGHGGAATSEGRLNLNIDTYAFLIDRLGMKVE